jgi:bisphosphoglycerate-independent phosphoglycerate mutase (AlkP superfamily)
MEASYNTRSFKNVLKKSTSKKNVDGRSTSSHDNKKFRTRSMEKQGGMTFGFRKTATAVLKPDG